MRFPFTFMGAMALGIGLWILVYLAAHRSLDATSRGVALATAIVCFGFGGYVLVRRFRSGPQN